MISSRNCIITLCICWIVCGCYQLKMPIEPTEEEIRTANYGEEGGGISELDKEATILIEKAFLKDPDSAKFKFGIPYKGFIVGEAKTEFGYFLDIYINAKNSYGAYTGYKLTRRLYRNGKLLGQCSYKPSLEKDLCVLSRR